MRCKITVRYTRCHFPVQDLKNPGAVLSLHSKPVFPLDTMGLTCVSGFFEEYDNRGN